jgi:serine/threonine protein phosphatase PrpC
MTETDIYFPDKREVSRYLKDMSLDDINAPSGYSKKTDNDFASTSPEERGECHHPTVHYCVGQTDLKGEDVVFLDHKRPWPGRNEESFCGTKSSEIPTFHKGKCDCGHITNEYSLFCVFDGHNGKHAARHASESVVSVLEKHLPRGNSPPVDHDDYDEWRQLIQRALAITLVELNSTFALKGIHAGCTATMVLVTDWLVTCINLGDSHAYLDTGSQLIRLTSDHRVAMNKSDRKRVELTGAIVAPVCMSGVGPADAYSKGLGPLRVWPGGLCISRAIGDFDVGPSIVPYGSITQTIIASSGGRILIGSDGVWDAFHKRSKPASMTRNWSLDVAPSKLISNILKQHGTVKDDTSLIVVDILPGNISFPDMVQASKQSILKEKSLSSSRSNGNLLCACFGGENADEPDMSLRGQKITSPEGSVKSGISYSSYSSKNWIATIVDEIDVAEALELMPEKSEPYERPEWMVEELKDALIAAAAFATDAWLDASGRTKPTGIPQRPSKVSFAEEPVKEDKPTSAFQRSSSHFFSDSVADSDGDFASKFGHYKKGGPTLESTPSTRVTAGYLRDMSVRAGRVYNSEASVRAGSQFRPNLEDPSVRLRGSTLDGSVHMKAFQIREEESNEGNSPDTSPANNGGGKQDDGTLKTTTVKRG